MISPTAIIGGVFVTAVLLVALFFGTRPAPAVELAAATNTTATIVATQSLGTPARP